MSLEQVNQVLGRALLDEGFRSQLLHNAEEALKGFDLTSQEIETLKKINADQFQALDQAFQAHLGGAEADITQAANFAKIDGGYFEKLTPVLQKIEYEYLKLKDPLFMKIDDVRGESLQAGNPLSAKWATGGPAATGGWSLPTILAVGVGAVVVLGAITAGIFFFRSNQTPTQSLGGEALTQPAADLSDGQAVLPEANTLAQSLDILCLPADEEHLCAVPAGQMAGLLGETAENPLMLPLTPEQASLLLSASGGSPQGVQGFTVMMLAGPDAYRIQLPDSSTGSNVVLLADAQGSLYFSAASYFHEGVFASKPDTGSGSASSDLSALAGTWESLNGPGSMTCAGLSMSIPAEPPIQVEFDQNGQAVLHEIDAESSTVQVTTSDNNTFLATVTTMIEGNPIVGVLEFSLVSPNLIEGTYSATYETENCTFERAVTMNRLSPAGTIGGDIMGPLKPAEFSVEKLFDPTGTFVSPYAVCIAFPDVCKDGNPAAGSINTLLNSWNTLDNDALFHTGGGGGAGKVNMTNSCDSSPAGTACIPLPEQGDLYLPPDPAGTDGGTNPTVVSILDVDAVGVINGIYDLWMMMGVPQAGSSDGFVNLNSDLIQVYALDTNTGQQTLWKDVTVTDSALEISTDQNRLFVLYLFGDQAAAQAAPQVFP